MAKFSKWLSRLECVYSVSKPIVENVEPIYVSDFIHEMFESKEQFGLGNTNLTHEWFAEFSGKNPKKAVSFVQGMLESKGHIVSPKSITEGIKLFETGFEDASQV